MNPDGAILSCIRHFNEGIAGNNTNNGLDVREFNKAAKSNHGCTQCWCASAVEFNLMTAMNIDAIGNYLRLKAL